MKKTLPLSPELIRVGTQTKKKIMKNLLFALFAIGTVFAFSACGGSDDPIDNGSVSLDKTTETLVYEQTLTLTPSYSNNVAKNKTFTWTSSNSDIATVEPGIAGTGKVVAKRVGETTIKFAASDGTISASCVIKVDPRSYLLGSIYFETGVDAQKIKSKESSAPTSENADSLVYNRTDGGNIEKVVYVLASSKLASTIVVLKPTIDNETSAQKYIEERFTRIDGISGGITYYDATVSSSYANTKVGIFKNLDENNLKYKLGVKYTTK